MIQYIRALVLSGKLQQYSGSQATAAALAAAGGAAAPAAAGGLSMEAGEDHRSLYQLLKELQAQVRGSG